MPAAEPATQAAVTPPAAPTAAERYISIASGVLLLVVAVPLWGWGVRLVFAGLKSPSWPPGLEQLLLPVVITCALTGFGAWRLLRLAAPGAAGRLSPGRTVLAAFGIATLIGAVW